MRATSRRRRYERAAAAGLAERAEIRDGERGVRTRARGAAGGGRAPPHMGDHRRVALLDIIGTCLTIAELRKIARRTGFLGDEARYGDYQIHGLFVEKMHDENVVARAVQKHLDTKYEGAIRKAKALGGDDALLSYWETAVDNGFVPGAYWALIGHPRLTSSVETRIFGDIHMMSHISGAAHRGDAREVVEARREKAEIARRLANVIGERNDELARLRAEIGRMSVELREGGARFPPNARACAVKSTPCAPRQRSDET